MEELTDAGPLWEVLNREVPTHLYHYTGPAGVIGILTSRTLWAGRPADMNDSTEQLLAHEYAEAELLRLQFPAGSIGEGMVDYAVDLMRMSRPLHVSMSKAYTVSLTSESDSLEQWRAYCPRSGGVALGFRAAHLRNVAADQNYLLGPCIYDVETQKAMVLQIVKHHLIIWDARRSLELPREGISAHLVHDLLSDLDRFAPLIKHSSFRAEHEWRLISTRESATADAGYKHVPSPTGIKVFREFKLLTDDHPVIRPGDPDETGAVQPSDQAFYPVIGPSLDPGAMDEAIRTLVPGEFGWLAMVGRTASPYR